jgi:hypothetical protein
MLIFEQ